MPLTALITGGSSGVGAELVSLFTERRYIVYFTYNSGRQRAEKVRQSLPKDSQAQVNQLVVSYSALISTAACLGRHMPCPH